MCPDVNIGVDGSRTLADALKMNTTVHHLTLWSMRAVCSALAFSMKFVRCGGTRMNAETNVGVEGARALAAALEVNSTLQHLNLSG